MQYVIEKWYEWFKCFNWLQWQRWQWNDSVEVKMWKTCVFNCKYNYLYAKEIRLKSNNQSKC